jgi:hypothetical protein
MATIKELTSTVSTIADVMEFCCKISKAVLFFGIDCSSTDSGNTKGGLVSTIDDASDVFLPSSS